MIIKFRNWDKHQPRKDYKRPYWFALANDFPTDQKFFDFTNDEKLCFVFLLCEASKQNTLGEISLIAEHWCRINAITPKVLAQTIEKIESVQIAYRVCTESERYITEHNITNTIVHPTEVVRTPKFDFEKAYRGYPRKQGKAKGISVLEKTIKTDESYQELLGAIEKYAAHVRRQKTEPQFIKLFSSFIGDAKTQPWRDWLDEDVGQTKTINKVTMSDEQFTRMAFGGEDE